jgi:shikimate kinase
MSWNFYKLFIDEGVKNSVNIYLTGTYAVGKTTTGKELAKILKKPFVDPDDLFKAKYGDHGVYGKKHGWRKLVMAISKLMRNIEGESIIPIALFGKKENDDLKLQDAKFCKKHGIIVFILPHKSLHKTIHICFTREQTRGYKIKKEDVRKRVMYSTPLYLQWADIVVYNEKDPRTTALRIKKELEKRSLLAKKG